MIFLVVMKCITKVTPQANGIETGMVELGFVCDKEFSEHFSYDQERISEYVATLVQDVQVMFQTLKKTKLTFVVSSIMIISELSGQPFVDASRNTDGTTNPAKMFLEFATWISSREMSNKSDILIVITGSTGNHKWYANPQSACKMDIGKAANIILFRSDSTSRFPHARLSTPIARSLGAEDLAGTACKEKTWNFDYERYNSPTSYYFSSCNDLAIYNFVRSGSASCLKVTNQNNENALVSKHSTLSVDNLCKTQYISYTNVSISVNQDICASESKCYQTGTLIGSVYPLYNTNCGANKFCFRGRCLPTGHILRHIGTSACLYTSDSPLLNETLTVRSCELSSYRYDELMLSTTGKGAFLVVATHNDVNTPDKCLTVNENTSRVVFSHCPTEIISSFMWDMVLVNRNEDNFLLCQRKLLKFVTVNNAGEIVLSEETDFQNPILHWALQTNAEQPSSNVSNIRIQEHPHVMAIDQPVNITVRLGLVCDYECGKIFRNNISAIENYWKFMIHDATFKFQPIRNLRIQFVVTTKFFLTGPVCSAFKGNSGFDSSNGTIQEVSDFFDAHFATYSNLARQIDVVLVTTGKIVQGRVSVKRGNIFCQDDEPIKQTLGTIAMKISGYSSNACDDLAGGFKMLFEPKTDLTKFGIGNCENLPCSKNSHGHTYFSHCDSARIMAFLQENKNCFTRQQSHNAPVLSLNDYSTEYPTFLDQCNNFDKDVPVFQTGTESCASTSCYIHGIQTKQLILVGSITPVYKTPCGTNRHCILGQCISKGFQLQHILSGKCINGKNSSPSRPVKLAECLSFTFANDELTIDSLTTNGFQMSIPKISEGEVIVSDLCLSINIEEQNLQYESCGSTATNNQVWEFLSGYANDTYFSLYNHEIAKCVGVDSNGNVVFESPRDLKNQRLLWRYFDPNFPNSNISAQKEVECHTIQTTDDELNNLPREDLVNDNNLIITTANKISLSKNFQSNEGNFVESMLTDN